MSSPMDDMNTSKSLDSILDTINWTKAGPSGYLDSKANERKAAAKQAIVEAVEGIYGDSDGLREFAGLNLIKSVPEVPSKRKETRC